MWQRQNIIKQIKIKLKKTYARIKRCIVYDENKCVCEEFYLTAIITRLCSIFPFKWDHNEQQQNVCEFHPSKVWIVYSLVQLIAHFSSIRYILLRDSTENAAFLSTLVSILELLAPCTMVVMTLCFIYRAKEFGKCLTIFAYYRKSAIICYETVRSAGGLAKILFLVMEVSLLIQTGLWMHLNKRIWPPANLDYLGTKYACGMIAVIFAYYSVLLSGCAGIASCVRCTILHILNAKSIHPLLSLDEVHSRYAFFGLYKFRLCGGLSKHHDFNINKMENINSMEKWDIIKFLIDELITTFKVLSNALTPAVHILYLTFLVQMVLTMYILVIVWNYDGDVIREFWVYFFSNVFSMLTEIIFVTIFLRTGTYVQTEFNSIQESILQYSPTVTDDFEELQIRLLVDKFKYEKKLRGDGTEMYTMKMFQMIIPTIITYFLVALQFRPLSAQN